MEQIKSLSTASNGNSRSERLAYSVSEAASVTGLGRTTLFALIGTGQLPSTKIGARRLIRRDDLEALLSLNCASIGG